MSARVRVAHITSVDQTLRFLLLAQLEALRDAGFDVVAISAPGPWGDDVRSRGIPVIDWPSITRRWDPGADVRAFRELLAILRRERFDLVHTHTPKVGVLGRLAARTARVPCVVNTVHGLYATPQDRFSKRAAVLGLEGIAALCSDLELYQSEEDLQWMLRRRLVSPAKARLLGNGIDLDHFDPAAVPRERRSAVRAELGVPDNAVVVGTVARLVVEKGFRELFAAAAAVRQMDPQARFVAIGDSAAEQAGTLDPAEIEGARADVVFTGWRKDVRDLVGAMDVFVLPSWREGLPRSAIEAAAMGKPLVLTDVRGCREVARAGVEALFVPARDPASLAAAITQLVRDSSLRERLGAAARLRAVETFDERRVHETLIESYRPLLARMGRLPTSDGGVRVRPALSGDAASLAQLHGSALPDSFLPALGQRFLTRLYRAFAADEDAIALVATDGPDVIGLAIGVMSTRRFSLRFVLRHGPGAAAAAAPSLLDRAVLRRTLETARVSLGGPLLGSQLVAIAVSPAWQGKGIGRRLASGVVDWLAVRGASEVAAVTSATNDEANAFYKTLGFRCSGEIAVHDGVASNVWVVQCPS